MKREKLAFIVAFDLTDFANDFIAYSSANIVEVNIDSVWTCFAKPLVDVFTLVVDGVMEAEVRLEPITLLATAANSDYVRSTIDNS